LSLGNIVIILHRPQKLVNIGGTVRAMKNMGMRQLRLVDPVAFTAGEIDAIAHRSQDIVEAIQIYPDLDSALADTHLVIGTTARRHGTRQPPHTPRAIAAEIILQTTQGLVALVFGPEDTGLNNSELDRCHQLVTIPTTTEYASLNLAQAVLIMAYELQLAASPTPQVVNEIPANAGQYEHYFHSVEQALSDVEFFKTEHATGILRTLRSLTYRAKPNQRELALLLAIAREISNYVRRRNGA
jgi:TrmH family RNA methyltransferase